MNFHTYLQTVKFRAAPLPLDKQIEHAALGMLSEAGELADLYKRELAYGKAFDHVNLLEECGDWVWYFTLEVLTLAERHGWNLENLCSKIDEAAREWRMTVPSMPEFVRLNSLGMLCAPNSYVYAHFYGDRALRIIVSFLNSCGFTFEQCLAANDAKLEKRTGKKFSQGAVLNRDLAGERGILETYASQTDTNPPTV
jgi:NTP pyrophosphatase (non-canonical NTP hydrolase)